MSAEAIAAQVVGNILLTGNSNSMHEEGQTAAAVEMMVRTGVSALCGCDGGADKVMFVDGGAHANEYVLHTVLPPRPKRLGGGATRDVLLIGDIEHPSLLERAATMTEKGYTTETIPVDKNTGLYSVSVLKEKLQSFGDRVAFVSTHHANNEIGTIQPVQEIGALIKQLTPHALFHIDCIQTFGKLPLEMNKWKADLISLSFHKVCGPKRCGAVVAANPSLIPSGYKATKDISSHLSGLVAAEQHIAKMKEANTYTLALRQKIHAGIESLCNELSIRYKELSQPPPVGIPGILNYLFPGMQGRHFVSMLSDLGLSISSGAACSVQGDRPSKVISSLRVNNEDYFSAVRLSFGADTTEAEADKLLEAMRVTLEKFKPNQVRELAKREFKREKRETKGDDEAGEATTGEGEKKKNGKPNKWDRLKARKEEKKANKQEEPPAVEIEFESEEEVTKIFAGCKKAEYGFDAVMLTLGELVLKGSNRKAFEKQMMANLRKKLESDDYAKQLTLWIPKGHPQAGFVLVFHLDPKDMPKGNNTQSVATIPKPCRQISFDEFENSVKPLLKEISGISTIAPVKMVPPEWKAIRAASFETVHCVYERCAANKPAEVSFGVTSRRADKKFPLCSTEMNRRLGSDVIIATEALNMQPPMKVNLMKPDLKLEIRVRQDVAMVMSHSNIEKGSGGLPDGVDSDGRVLCLLSGGHDSPVACHKVITRGCRVGFVHFDGYPYVGKEVVLKIRKLQEALNRHQSTGGPLFVVPFSKIQELIAETKEVPASFRTILYRIFMFKLAAVVADKGAYKALCTGDNIGQVASQTLCNMSVLDGFSDMFVVRPLVTFGKEEIIKLATELKLFEITKMYGTADCCTVFKPANPVLHVQKRDLDRVLGKLYAAGMEKALEDAITNMVTYSHEDKVGVLPPVVSHAPLSCPYEPKQKVAKRSPASDALTSDRDVDMQSVEN
eukprot:TRINITY_DN12894_c0_g1_i1.p1 TRINITY_DN12894_c0_g1~~TRINITY_DN12894_c0_g1_i1.p1  ORF type:complete len:1011 (+),score=349.77 TRINITY_DN12894_c0_g1_i1:169-3033(+)